MDPRLNKRLGHMENKIDNLLETLKTHNDILQKVNDNFITIVQNSKNTA